MTYLSSFACPYCNGRHYIQDTVTDDGICLYCGKNMNTGKQVREGLYNFKFGKWKQNTEYRTIDLRGIRDVDRFPIWEKNALYILDSSYEWKVERTIRHGTHLAYLVRTPRPREPLNDLQIFLVLAMLGLIVATIGLLI